MQQHYDYVVIGGGHNGLVSACYLADAGHSVVVLEKRPVIGGLSISQPLVEHAPGHLLSPGAIDAVFIRQTPIVPELQLEQYGLHLIDVDPGYGWVDDEGETLMLYSSVEDTARDIEYFSRQDARQYLELAEIFGRILDLQAPFLAKALDQIGWREMLAALVKTVGHRDLRRTLQRLLAVSAYEAISDSFESEALRGLYAYWCAIACPPDAENSGVYLASFSQIHQIGCSRPQGGMSALMDSLKARLQASGGEVRTGAEVTEILTEHKRTVGVRLVGGECLTAAKGIISCCAPQITLGQLLSDYDQPADAKTALPFMPANASNLGPFKIDMAIGGPTSFERASARRAARDSVNINNASLMTGTLADHVNHTQQVKQGQMGDRPPIWMTLLAQADPTLAPAGQSTAYLYTGIPVHSIQCSESIRETATQMLVDSASRHIDGLDKELGRSILAPIDFQQEYGAPDGCIYHVDMLPSRLGPMRPAKGLGGSVSPIPGLYLGGAGSHPGGGVFGLPGKFAAQAALKTACAR